MNKRELKEAHSRLSEREPFTPKEQEEYNKKDQSMIRNIQILNGIDKDRALQTFKRYKSTGKKEFQRLTRATRRKAQKISGGAKNKPSVEGRIHKKPAVKKDAKRKKPSQRTKAVEQHEKTKRSAYLKDEAKKSNKNYPRVEKASKKYIDASKPELEHGVNSEWSKNYREKIGLNRNYEGRVIK